jgi:hypothetical protein
MTMTPEEELDRLKLWTSAEVCHYLAMKVRRHRQDAELSQAAFASQAGIALRTYKRFEAHGQANLDTFVAALRAMGRTHYLMMLFAASARVIPPPTLKERLLDAKLRSQSRGQKGGH